MVRTTITAKLVFIRALDVKPKKYGDTRVSLNKQTFQKFDVNFYIWTIQLFYQNKYMYSTSLMTQLLIESINHLCTDISGLINQ